MRWFLVAAIACAHAAPPPALQLPAFDGTSLVEAAPGILVDPAIAPADRTRLVSNVAAARAALADKLGVPLASEQPLVILCKTVACGEWFAGPSHRSVALVAGGHATGARFIATRTTIVVLRTDDGARGYLTHELAHIELNARTHGAPVPAWFDDGVAIFLSGAPDCSQLHVAGIDDLRRMDAHRAWEDYTNIRNALQPAYCQARAEVAAWALRGGKLTELFDALARGASFDAAYGPLAIPATRTTPMMSISTDLGDARKAFTLAAWVKPEADAGVLALLSDTPVGAGYCAAMMGFDAHGKLVGEVLAGPKPDAFAVVDAPDPMPIARWTHVALTWSPGGREILYVDGREVAGAPARPFFAPGVGATTYVTWGGVNLAGAGCWRGAIANDAFRGSITDVQIVDRALAPAEVAELARHAP